MLRWHLIKSIVSKKVLLFREQPKPQSNKQLHYKSQKLEIEKPAVDGAMECGQKF